MKYRKCNIFTGKEFSIPNHIVRIDTKKTHGWQLRYGKSKLFSDFTTDGSGATESLQLAIEELGKRIATLPAPTGLRTEVLSWKQSDLPLGVSGPIARFPRGRKFTYYDFQVSIPLPDGTSTNRNIYIATENTMTKERYEKALEKAIALRQSYVTKRKSDATKFVRQEAINAGLINKK